MEEVFKGSFMLGSSFQEANGSLEKKKRKAVAADADAATDADDDDDDDVYNNDGSYIQVLYVALAAVAVAV